MSSAAVVIGTLRVNIWNFNKTLTNEVFSFEHPGPGGLISVLSLWYTIYGYI